MYTREELQKRIFARNKEEWLDATAKDYHSKEEVGVRTVERGIILPLERIIGTHAFAGGVCDENFSFVAGSKRNLDKAGAWHSCEQSYAVDGGG